MTQNLQTCCCRLDWCKAIRSEHPLKNNMVRMCKMKSEILSWCSLLGTDELKLAKCPRVWCGHFHHCDLVVSCQNGSLNYEGLTVGPTMYAYSRSTSAYGAPARPAASKAQVSQSAHDLDLLRTGGTVVLSTKRCRIESSTISSLESTAIVSVGVSVVNENTNTSAAHGTAYPVHDVKRGPKLGSKRPINQSFIGTADCVVMLMKEIEKHAKHCLGSLSFKSDQIKVKGLALKIVCTCTEGRLCRAAAACETDSMWAASGAFTWHSCLLVAPTSPRIVANAPALPHKLVPSVHVKYAIAVAFSPAKRKHCEDLLVGMLLDPPCRASLVRINADFVLLPDDELSEMDTSL